MSSSVVTPPSDMEDSNADSPSQLDYRQPSSWGSETSVRNIVSLGQHSLRAREASLDPISITPRMDDGEEEDEEDEDEDEEGEEGPEDAGVSQAREVDELAEEEDGDGSFGDDEEEVHIAADAYRWKIEHSKGEYRLGAGDFIGEVEEPCFNGKRALEMLQTLYTMDYGSRKVGSRPVHEDDGLWPTFYLDMLVVIGKPLEVITRPSGFFDNLTISFKSWSACYSTKHLHGIPFDIANRTFRVATAASREAWFIVMHPVAAPVSELPGNRRERQKRLEESSGRSALKIRHAGQLATYITQIFTSAELVGEGVEPSWKLGGPDRKRLTSEKWTTFQERFVDGWADFVEQRPEEDFWSSNRPAFHAYDYGANIEMDMTPELRSLRQETRLRRMDESDGEEESEGDEGEEGEEEDEQEDGEEGEEDDGRDIDDNEAAGQRHSFAGRSSVARRSASTQLEEVDYEPFYQGGLRELRDALEQKYMLANIGTFSYALAVNIACLDRQKKDPKDGSRLVLCPLANRNAVSHEYDGHRDFTFFPLAFHPAHGNFSSSRPPKFLTDGVLAVMRENMSIVHGGTDPLSFGCFQGYSNVKRNIRHTPNALLATKGIATAALAFPAAEARTRRTREKRDRLLRALDGSQSPSDPEASKPFAREARLLEAAIDRREYAFRMEQVIHVDVDRLRTSRRTFSTVLNPIFQLMRFFYREKQRYRSILHTFQPDVFPGVLRSFAKLFSAALEEIRRRFIAGGSKGLGVALCEAVAAIDRLGSYCMTGLPRSLMGSVMDPLGTIDGIKTGAWPYVNPALLRLVEGREGLSLSSWPRREKDGRPILMHISSIAFHYGQEAAGGRFSNAWFQELGGMSIKGPNGAKDFLDEVFSELWIPQMVAFVLTQLQRQAGKSASGDQRETSSIERWAASETPFTSEEYTPVLQRFVGPNEAGYVRINKTRKDFAEELYEACLATWTHEQDQRSSSPSSGRYSFSSPQSTWFLTLRAAIVHTPAEAVSREYWIGALSAIMVERRIECMPGSHRGRLSARRMVTLIGTAARVAVLTARPGSLKRLAMEAEQNASQPRKRRAIDLGYAFPPRDVPDLVKKGFSQLRKLFVKGDERVREHYAVAEQTLVDCLGDWKCDLMLMIALTLASSSVTPSVDAKERKFIDAKTRRDPALFAANLVTRMLWFLRPEGFPWEKGAKPVMGVPEMAQKLEHKGINNRMLCQLGWVNVVRGRRDHPQFSELEFQSDEKLWEMRKELRDFRKDAGRFIERIFGRGLEANWVERCAGIVVG